MDEMVKTIASRITDAMPGAASFTCSQMAASSNGFNSSVMSTAATTGSIVTEKHCWSHRLILSFVRCNNIIYTYNII
jgi:hypothetical protein